MPSIPEVGKPGPLVNGDRRRILIHRPDALQKEAFVGHPISRGMRVPFNTHLNDITPDDITTDARYGGPDRRHFVADAAVLLLAVVTHATNHAANFQDRGGAKLVLGKLLGQLIRLQVIWTDGAYAGRLAAWCASPPSTDGCLRLMRVW